MGTNSLNSKFPSLILSMKYPRKYPRIIMNSQYTTYSTDTNIDIGYSESFRSR